MFGPEKREYDDEPDAIAKGVAALLLIAMAVTAPQSSAVAGEPVPRMGDLVVSASRVPVRAETVGAAVSVITREDIENSQTRIVSDILRQTPGLAVSRTGPPGALTQVRIRGAEANQTLVRIDGIEVNDPAFGSEFDFASLLATDLERIEILRGPQSALYGSDALGGVIDIRTRRGDGPPQITGLVEGGSFGTFTGNATLAGGNDRGDYALSLGGLRTDGINVSRFGGEKDGFSNLTTSFVGAIRPLENIEFEAALRYTETHLETDNQDFGFPPGPTQGLVIDTDDETDRSFLYGRAGVTVSLFDGAWQQTAEVALTDTGSRFFSDGTRNSRVAGRRIKAAYQGRVFFGTSEIADAEHQAIFAFEREETSFENEAPAFGVDVNVDNVVNSLVGEYRLGLWDRLHLSGALRHDDNRFFQDATTWRATAAVLVPETSTRIHGSYGTGVTDPGFTELFGFNPATFTGNPGLEPERSESFDIGVEQGFLDDRVIVDVTWFAADLRDEIVTVFDPVTFRSSVDNLDGKSERRGIEVTLSAEILPGLNIDGSYTWTLSEGADNREEVRRPMHAASLNVNYRFFDDRANVNLGIDFTGDQKDAEFIAATPADRVTLNAFTLVNIAGSYRVSDQVELFARVENLLDEDYEEVFSFRSSGIGAFAGVRIKLDPF